MANLSRRSTLKATFGLAGTTGLGLLVACSAQAPVAPTSAPDPPETIVPGKPAATSTAPATLKGTRIVGIFPSGSTFEAMYQQEAKDFEAATGNQARVQQYSVREP